MGKIIWTKKALNSCCQKICFEKLPFLPNRDVCAACTVQSFYRKIHILDGYLIDYVK